VIEVEMSEREERRDDKDPAPTEHADAERVTEASNAEEIEQDPAYNPQEPPLRDIKGG
jgi:hypothetical protein